MPNLVEANYGPKVIGNHAARGAMSADQLANSPQEAHPRREVALFSF